MESESDTDSTVGEDIARELSSTEPVVSTDKGNDSEIKENDSGSVPEVTDIQKIQKTSRKKSKHPVKGKKGKSKPGKAEKIKKYKNGKGKRKKDSYFKMIALSIVIIIIIAITLVFIYYQTFDTDSDGIFDWDDDDDDNDGMPDIWEKTHNFDPLDPSDGKKDPDKDNLKNTNEYDHNTDPHNPDSDSDGLSDGDEIDYRTDPLIADTDSDGMLDGWEVKYGLNPKDASDANVDSDKDGYSHILGGKQIYFNYTNLNEHDNRTDPKNPDTDSDQIYDGWELFFSDEIEKIKQYNPDFNYSFDPLDPSDGAEDIDVDITYKVVGDGLSNTAEFQNGTNPLKPDSDGDGLTDAEEINFYNTDPNWYDSDSDLLADGWEVKYGLNPLAVNSDSDGVNDSQEDEDSDGLTNFKEYVVGTDPTLPDSDFDGMPDGWEVANSLDPLKMDQKNDYDNDSLSNYLENIFGTDPFNPDTDSDLLTDGEEAVLGWHGILTDGIFRTGPATPRYFSDPLNPDSDSDRLPDYDEIKVYISNATNKDTDGDGLSDYDELKIERTNASRIDSDADGLNDTDELKGTYGYFTNPNRGDTDMDGLLDGEEIVLDFYPGTTVIDATDPLKTDTDSDGIPDGWEAKFGLSDDHALIKRYDTEHATDLLSVADPDDDGVVDIPVWLINPLDGTDAKFDPDHDSYDKLKYSNLKEFLNGTDPLSWDSDSDLMSDGWEVRYGLDPKDPSDAAVDSDMDGFTYYINGIPYSDDFTNYEEYKFGVDTNNDSIIDSGTTDPKDRDTDNDNIDDFEEFWLSDFDNDGLTTGWELLFKGALQDGYSPKFAGGIQKYVGQFDPYDNDTDNDNKPDGLEDPDGDEITNILEHGSNPGIYPGSSDPTDPTSIPSRSASRQVDYDEHENQNPAFSQANSKQFSNDVSNFFYIQPQINIFQIPEANQNNLPINLKKTYPL